MGVGPAYAIPKVLEATGLSKDEIDFYEINEAFASQAVYSVQQIGIPFEKVNLNGGAIAIGHPLGCSTSSLLLVSVVRYHYHMLTPDRFVQREPGKSRPA